MAEFVKVAKTNEIESSGGKSVEVNGRKIALFNVDGKFYALDDMCTHRGGPLHEGQVDGTTVTCAWHGATFDITNGKNLTPPAMQPVASYPCRVTGDDIEVEV